MPDHAQEPVRLFGLLGFRAEQGQVREGWEARRVAQRQLRGRKRAVAAAQQAGQQRVLGVMGLQQHLASAVGAPGPAGHLDQQLGKLFRCPEVGAEQPFVNPDHCHQDQIGQIMTLGQHLGADQDAAGIAELREMGLQRVASAGGAAVDPQHRHVRKALRQQLLDPLRSRPLGLQRQPPAVGTGIGRRPPCAAVVALQSAATGMHGHGGIALTTLCAPAAVVAQQHRRITATVLEHQDLALGCQRGGDRIEQLR